MHAPVLRSPHIGHASLLDQAHSLKLELAGRRCLALSGRARDRYLTI